LGIVEAIVGAVVGFLLGEARQRWRDKRERETLVRALAAEIEQNAKVTDTIEQRYSGRDLKNMINDSALSSMTTATWRDYQGKAYLLPTGLGEVLQRYFSLLQNLLAFLSFARDERVNEQMNIALRKLYAEGLPEQDEARNRLMRTDPYLDALDKTLTAQDQARQRVDEYLSPNNDS